MHEVIMLLAMVVSFIVLLISIKWLQLIVRDVTDLVHDVMGENRELRKELEKKDEEIRDIRVHTQTRYKWKEH